MADAEGDALLAACGITAGYGGSAVLRDVTLTVRRGSITGIIGPNGCGKSTLLKVLVGYLRPTAGTVVFAGQDVTRLAPEDRIARGLGYVAQGRSLFASQTVDENLRLGAYLVRDASVRSRRQQDVLLRFAGLAQRRGLRAGMLSGGEARMLEVARMLMMAPSFAILDEPSIGLSPAVVETLYEHVRRLRDEGVTFLIVEQNVRKLLAVADYVYALESGRNSVEGTAATLSDEGVLQQLYLGGQTRRGPPEPGAPDPRS